MMGNKELVRVGVIGCGMISKEYKFACNFVKNTKIVAAMDLSLDRAKNIGGKGHAYTDLDEMYEKEDFDVAYIATPHNLHKPMIKQAFEQGKHVFCEKPITISVEDAREIQQMDKKYTNLKLGIDYQYRYDHKCYNLARGIQDNHLGDVYYANCNVFFCRNLNYFDKGPWRTKWETSGGGTMLIHGSHIIDILLWALGEPKSVMGRYDTLKFKDIEVEDVGFGIVEFENGTYAQINNSMIINPKMQLLGDKVELQVFGKNGRCHYIGPWPRPKLKWKGVKKYKIEKNTKGIAHLGRCIKAYAEWILNDTPFLNTIEESSRVLRLISALYISSKSGKKEQIEKL